MVFFFQEELWGISFSNFYNRYFSQILSVYSTSTRDTIGEMLVEVDLLRTSFNSNELKKPIQEEVQSHSLINPHWEELSVNVFSNVHQVFTVVSGVELVRAYTEIEKPSHLPM